MLYGPMHLTSHQQAFENNIRVSNPYMYNSSLSILIQFEISMLTLCNCVFQLYICECASFVSCLLYVSIFFSQIAQIAMRTINLCKIQARVFWPNCITSEQTCVLSMTAPALWGKMFSAPILVTLF